MRCGTRRRIGGTEDETYYSFKMRQKHERFTTPLNNLSIKSLFTLICYYLLGDIYHTLNSREHCNCNVSMNNDEKQRAIRRIKEKYHY
jgi:hypothetical protein